jgi:hypothetical protein
MLDAIVNQFLKSDAGSEVLGQLKGKGLELPEAQAAVTATAEGAMQQLGGQGGLAGLASAVGGAGGLGGLVGGLLGGGSAPSATGGLVSSLAAPISQFVAQKTGLSPEIAAMVVNVALPKLMALIQGQGVAALPGSDSGGLAGMLGGFLK